MKLKPEIGDIIAEARLLDGKERENFLASRMSTALENLLKINSGEIKLSAIPNERIEYRYRKTPRGLADDVLLRVLRSRSMYSFVLIDPKYPKRIVNTFIALLESLSPDEAEILLDAHLGQLWTKPEVSLPVEEDTPKKRRIVRRKKNAVNEEQASEDESLTEETLQDASSSDNEM